MSNRPLIHGLEQPIEFVSPASEEAPTVPRLRRVRRDSGVASRLSVDARQALSALSRTLVGQMNLKDAQRALRTSMSQEALARCNGSRRAAAAVLGVDRRYVQRLADEGHTSDPEEITEA
jgi:DNA-binding NtrC family response regulator